MTPEQLDDIEARATAATGGPWEAYMCPDPAQSVVEAGDKEIILPWLNGSSLDAEFVANARADVPALIAEVRRLRAAMQDLADHGLHADLNPTVPNVRDAGNYGWWMNYLERIDGTLRERARAALETKEQT